jgi:acetolactate synthase-1/2/3 large subunit
MTLCELATMQQEQIKVNIAIINNGYLGMVRQWQEFFYDKRYAATPLLSPDFVKLAEAYGIEARSVTTRKDVIPAVEAARKHHGGVLLDFRVEQEDSVYPMVPAGADLHKMIRVRHRSPRPAQTDSGTARERAPKRRSDGGGAPSH